MKRHRDFQKLRHVMVWGAAAALIAACATQQQAFAQAAPSEPSAAPMPQPLGPAEINVTDNNKHRYGELQLAVNPKNPDNIVMAVQELGYSYACLSAKSPDCEMVQTKLVGPGQPPLTQPKGTFGATDFNKVVAFVSFNRGKTWKRADLPNHPSAHPHLTGRGDPSVTAGPDGAFYFSWDALDWGTPDAALPSAGVAASKSTDGGLTWSDPVLTGVPADGPKVSSDLNTGTIFAAGSSALGPLSTGDPKAQFNVSRDRWLVSSKDGMKWTKPQGMGGQASMSAAHGVLAAVFKTAPQDNVMASANNQLCGSAAAPCIVFETTKNAGAAWSRTVLKVENPNTGRPGVAADPSKAGHFTVFVPVNGDKEFWIYETRDSGKTWSGPSKIAEDATKQHYHPWIAYAPSGVLGLIWRTREPASGQTAAPAAPPSGGPPALGAGPAPAPYSIWAAISRDGGATFSEPLRVSRADSPAAPAGASGDDYTGLALDREYLYAGWPDWRPGDRQNLFRAIKFDEFKDRR
jgi:hypothetical protein